MADDKKLHLACGFAISLTIGLYNIYCGVGAGILAGALKEGYDYLNQDKHTVDVWDFIYTSAGAIIAFLLLLVIAYAIK